MTYKTQNGDEPGRESYFSPVIVITALIIRLTDRLLWISHDGRFLGVDTVGRSEQVTAVVDDIGLRNAPLQHFSWKLVCASQVVETNNVVDRFRISGYQQCWNDPDLQALRQEWAFFRVDFHESTFDVFRGKNFQVFVHNLATECAVSVKVTDYVLAFLGNVEKIFLFWDFFVLSMPQLHPLSLLILSLFHLLNAFLSQRLNVIFVHFVKPIDLCVQLCFNRFRCLHKLLLDSILKRTFHRESARKNTYINGCRRIRGLCQDGNGEELLKTAHENNRPPLSSPWKSKFEDKQERFDSECRGYRTVHTLTRLYIRFSFSEQQNVIFLFWSIHSENHVPVVCLTPHDSECSDLHWAQLETAWCYHSRTWKRAAAFCSLVARQFKQSSFRKWVWKRRFVVHTRQKNELHGSLVLKNLHWVAFAP